MATRAEREAKARLATAKKALADYDRDEAASVKACEAAKKKLATLEKESPLIIATIANVPVAMRIGEVKAYYGAPKDETA